MVNQDRSESTHSGAMLQAGMIDVLHSVTGTELNEQFSCSNDLAPKARKPYTISKQRERWTEEEHKKFLEALKLYGRAWRQIEEHVGTKTAVQIRSHAQKFFSKVVRESGGSNPNSLEPIDIPPPRPKRTPMHPYPRKLANLRGKKALVVEEPIRSTSPNLSVSDQENQSPTSVLSPFGSDVLVSPDSDTRTGSLSPVSSAAGSHQFGGLVPPEKSNMPIQNGAESPISASACSVPEEKFSVKLELFARDESSPKECSGEELCTRSIKLFGMTVLVNHFNRPSCTNDVEPPQISPCMDITRESIGQDTEFAWNPMSRRGPESFHFEQHQNENSNPQEADSSGPQPWGTLYGGLSIPMLPFINTELSTPQRGSTLGSSWTCSNNGSINEGENGGKSIDSESQSSCEKGHTVLKPVFKLKASEKSAFSEVRSSLQKCTKGFTPYKKMFSGERLFGVNYHR